MNARKSFRDCIVKPGETSPYANLLVDLAFKKAFDPDKPTSRNNLINLLNDLLEPQLKRPIKNVWTRSVAKNLSGSKASRTAIFDLHCKDDLGSLIEIVRNVVCNHFYNVNLIKKCPDFSEHLSQRTLPALVPKGSKRGGPHYAFVATLTSSIFFSTEPSSIALIALSKPSLMLAALLLM